MKNVFQVVNELVQAGIIETYAVGGAIAAFFYVEPFYTHDVDIFFPITVESSQIFSLEPIYKHLEKLGYHPNKEAVEIEGWPVQFLPVADDLVKEAVDNAETFNVGDVPVRVMSAAYLVAIMLRTGRPKDFARVKLFTEQGVVNLEFLYQLIKEFNLEAQWQKYTKLM